MHKRTVLSTSAFALCLISLPLCPSTSQAYGGGPTANNDAWMQATRRAGRQADVRQVARLTKALQDGTFMASDPDAKATMFALAQIGSPDALPAINAFLQQEQKKTTPDSDAVNAALVARARIVAEQGAGIIPSGLVIQRFYTMLQETPETINAGTAAYVKEKAIPRASFSLPPPLAVYALRTVADMAYQHGGTDLVQSPEVTALRFDLDPRSALKVKLAPLSERERAAWLVETLSQSKVVADKEDYEIQLAGDLGAIVEPLATAKVQQMHNSQEKPPRAAYHALFSVLCLSGEIGQAVVKPYEQDKDPWIAEYAQQGAAGTFTVGY